MTNTLNIWEQSTIFIRSSYRLITNRGFSISTKMLLTFDFIRYSARTLLISVFHLDFKHENLLGYRLHVESYSNYVSQFIEIFVNNIYYFERKNIKKIIDCGSNIGISIIYFRLVYPGATIYGFEPNPDTYSLLKENIDFNRFTKIHLKNAAVSKSNNFIKFNINPLNKVSIDGSIFDLIKSSKNILVKSVSLNGLIEKHNNIDILKLDIEGAETQVLDNIKGNLQKVKYIVLEFHKYKKIIKINSLSEFLKILENNNFGYYIHEAVGQKLVDYNNHLLIIKALKN